LTGGTLNLPAGAGRAGEAAGVSYLRRNGYEVLRTNYRVREGEIDIVARHRGQTVFVEVKTRRSSSFGSPEESLTATKRQRLIAAAQSYLAENGGEQSDWRIDLLAVELDRAGRPLRVELIESAVGE
jgi:putative endonuclease